MARFRRLRRAGVPQSGASPSLLLGSATPVCRRTPTACMISTIVPTGKQSVRECHACRQVYCNS
eukprot:5706750-Alexandrium_andersonii.AAC.1